MVAVPSVQKALLTHSNLQETVKTVCKNGAGVKNGEQTKNKRRRLFPGERRHDHYGCYVTDGAKIADHHQRDQLTGRVTWSARQDLRRRAKEGSK